MDQSKKKPNQNIEIQDFTTDGGLGYRARIGLIVLQTDQTIEYEINKILSQEGVAIYHSRIPNALEVSPETLSQMEIDLPQAASLLPKELNFDAIGYGCTSGATIIGEQNVERIIRSVHSHSYVSNPITACKNALNALQLTRIALVTPYAPEVTLEMQANLTADGFTINAVTSFNQSNDFTVARISPQSILNAVTCIGSHENCDGVFISCTSLRALEIISEAEQALGKPVIASNQVLAWDLMRSIGLGGITSNSGSLLQAL